MSPKLWVIITGGLLGIVAMRLVIGQLLAMVSATRRWSTARSSSSRGSGIKLLIEYAHSLGLDPLRDPEVAVARPDRRDLHGVLPVRPHAGTATDADVIDDEANALINDQIR